MVSDTFWNSDPAKSVPSKGSIPDPLPGLLFLDWPGYATPNTALKLWPSHANTSFRPETWMPWICCCRKACTSLDAIEFRANPVFMSANSVAVLADKHRASVICVRPVLALTSVIVALSSHHRAQLSQTRRSGTTPAR